MSGSHGNDQSLQWKIGPGGVGGGVTYTEAGYGDYSPLATGQLITKIYMINYFLW